MWTDLLPIVVFIFLAVLVFALGQAFFGRRRREVPTGDRVLDRERRRPNFLVRALAAIIPDLGFGRTQGLDRDLRRAGLYRPYARIEFLATRNLLVLAGIAIAAAAYVIVGNIGPTIVAQLLLITLFLIGWLYVIPRLYLVSVGSARVQRILDGLPDALDMITMCVSAGLPFQEAVRRVKEQIRAPHPELAGELDIIERQATMGATEQALRDFAERIDEPDVYALAEVVAHAEHVGADVGAVMSDYSDNIREGIRHRAEQRGNTMSLRLLFPIMLCLAPAAYIVLVTPSVVELRQFLIRENEPGGAFDLSGAQRAVERGITPARPPVAP